MYKQKVLLRCPGGCPVMLLFDNINIHHGRPRHQRITQKVKPVMWNFTVRAVLKPDISAISSLQTGNVDKTPQRALKELEAEDFFLGMFKLGN
jgi:hypothetical protein